MTCRDRICDAQEKMKCSKDAPILKVRTHPLKWYPSNGISHSHFDVN